jgi:hypothetical protein
MKAKRQAIEQSRPAIERAILGFGFMPDTQEYRRRVIDAEYWLENFEAAEIPDAIDVLSKVTYVDDNQIREGIERAAGMIKRLLDDRLGKTLFFQLGESPSDSGGNFLYHLRRVLGLQANAFPPTHPAQWTGTDYALVFIDDIIGSGSQAVRSSHKLLDNNRHGPPTIYCALYAYIDGLNRVKEESSFSHVIAVQQLTDADRAFHVSSFLFREKQQRERLQELALKYGTQLYPDHPLGYENSQLLITFAHNTPNNTLPIIWAGPDSESVATRSWYPLFRRMKAPRSRVISDSAGKHGPNERANGPQVLAGSPELPASLDDAPTTVQGTAQTLRSPDLKQAHDRPNRRLSPNSLKEEPSPLSGQTVVAAITMLLLEQYADGSWGRTLHRASGRAFTIDTTDVRSGGPLQKKAVSITSWAAQGTLKLLGKSDYRFLQAARSFIASRYDETTHTFGNVYRHASGAPLVGEDELFMSNPRHTATALKLLEETDGMSQLVSESTRALVALECEGGGWGERRHARPNSLSTAYVLDYLTKLQKRGSYRVRFTSEDWTKIKSAVLRGYAWLANVQGSDQLWSYEGQRHLAPFYTTNVLAFAPEFAKYYPENARVAISNLLSARKRGLVEYAIGKCSSVSPTALLAFALLRIDRKKYSEEIKELAAAVDSYFLNANAELANYTILDSLFTVALASALGVPVSLRNDLASIADAYDAKFDRGFDFGDSPVLTNEIKRLIEGPVSMAVQVERT